jgi:hypothetical protein
MRLSGLGSSIDTLALAIQTQEGYYPNSLAFTNNNPGNLMPAGQPGCTVGAGGFCSFPTYDAGYAALVNQLNLDASRGYTLLQFTTKYLGGDPNNPGTAPGGDPNVYAANLAAAAGVSVNDPLSAALYGGYDPSTGLPLDTSNLGDAAGSDTFTMALAVGGALLAAWLLNR